MVNRQSIYKYYWFGTCIRYLQDAMERQELRTDQRGGIVDNIEAFFRYLDELGLVVTERASSDLLAFKAGLSETRDATLTPDQAIRLRDIVSAIRNTLEAEIQGFEAYIVTPKRLDVKKLIDDTPSLLAPDVHSRLPIIAQFDIAEAGKCIAYERPTAAAFHLLRATERVLVDFYECNVKQKRVKRMWGPMVEHLKGRRKAKQHEILLNNLDNIRRSFRNPTQHPELTYDIHEVQDLWGLCTDVINRMGRVL